MVAPGADQDLAAATRKAQENLRTLIESLGAASRSLLQPAPPSTMTGPGSAPPAAGTLAAARPGESRDGSTG